MKRSGSFLILFCVLATLDLLLIWQLPDHRWITKPLILLSLIVHFNMNVSYWSRVKKLFGLGLIAALIGDIFLLFPGSNYFLLGLGSFLIMQILFSISFYYDSFRPLPWKLLYAIILVIILSVYTKLLWPGLGQMKIAVLLYSICIVSMSFLTVTRSEGKRGYRMVLFGALLFMISDGFLAWTKFHNSLRYGSIIIMSTYIFAQYLITIGFIKSLEKKYS